MEPEPEVYKGHVTLKCGVHMCVVSLPLFEPHQLYVVREIVGQLDIGQLNTAGKLNNFNSPIIFEME